RIHAQLDACKSAQSLAVIERVLQSLVGERIPLLEKVKAQHPLDADRRPPSLSPGIMRLDHPAKPGPRNHLFHLAQKALPASHLLFSSILTLRKTHLVFHARHRRSLTQPYESQSAAAAIKSAIP